MKLVKSLKSTGTRKKASEKAASTRGTTAPATSAPVAPALKTVATSVTTKTSGQTVVIEAKVDVGYGNALYLRGEGEGLSWNRGVPLTCVDNSTWKWSGEATDKLKFKLLLNDAVWASGEDLVAKPGDKVRVSPFFN